MRLRCRPPCAPWRILAAAAAVMLGAVSPSCRSRPRYPDDLVAQGILLPGAERSWARSYACHGARCTVRANAGPRAAEYLSQLVDAELRALERMLGRPCAERVSVKAYASLEEFRRATGRRLVTPGTWGTFDMCTGEIRLALTRTSTTHPRNVLLHEVVHFYLHVSFDFRAPEPWSDKFPAGGPCSVPWWLDEGLATYLETARLRDGELSLGAVNRDRHRELLRLLETDRCPPLKSVLARPWSAAGSSADYAVAWGIVYALIQHTDLSRPAAGRHALARYLEACAAGFYGNPPGDFADEFTESGELAPDFEDRWERRVADQSLRVFQQLVLPDGCTLQEWEERWRRRMAPPPAAR